MMPDLSPVFSWVEYFFAVERRLETDNGYFILIGVMVAIAITMLGFFQYHGWFE